ncbi:hypothetical protein niasHS_010223 [Heterodera schachtii]|uniref:Uncharacterized protein n=1 Tax=Heterodera schachtii TaxID=97005 RepID=A0ABD2IZ45_HETSC
MRSVPPREAHIPSKSMAASKIWGAVDRGKALRKKWGQGEEKHWQSERHCQKAKNIAKMESKHGTALPIRGGAIEAERVRESGRMAVPPHQSESVEGRSGGDEILGVNREEEREGAAVGIFGERS